MTIKDFLKTENGKRYEDALKGCDSSWQVEYWECIENYREVLKENGWTNEDIDEQIDMIYSDMYKSNRFDTDFVLVIN